MLHCGMGMHGHAWPCSEPRSETDIIEQRQTAGAKAPTAAQTAQHSVACLCFDIRAYTKYSMLGVVNAIALIILQSEIS